VRTVWVLRLVVWFLGGVVASAALIVVIPPLDLVLLLGVSTAAIATRLRDGEFGPRSTGMLLGLTAFSLYAVIWALTLGSPGVSSSTATGAILLTLS